MMEAKNGIQVFLSWAFPESSDFSLIPAVTLENTEEIKLSHKADLCPWAILVENLWKEEDVETLLFYQIWLSKKISFAAHLSNTFVSNWIGNYNFYANTDQEDVVLSTLQDTLADQTSIISNEV